jgi:hypothetical protein
MSRFADHLWRDLVQEHGETIADTDRTGPGRTSVLRRPRVLAGGTLGLAAVGTAVALVLGAAGGTPAYAVTTNGDGSVLVALNHEGAIEGANAQLTSMGIHEQINIQMATGPALVKGPVTCAPAKGGGNLPLVRVLLDKDGTEVILPGTTGGNTGVGTWHLAACYAELGNSTNGA